MITIFFRHFIIASALISVSLVMIMVLKRSLRTMISARWQYNISLLGMVIFMVPLVPAVWLVAVKSETWRNLGMLLPAGGPVSDGIAGKPPVHLPADPDWLQNFAFSVERMDMKPLTVLLMLVWFAGMAAAAVFMYQSSRNLKLVKESVIPAGEDRLGILFDRCKQDLGIRRKIVCGTSVLAGAPSTIGCFRPVVVLPAAAVKYLNEDEVYYIFLHELMHCKYRDPVLNHLLCIIQVIYWFHPLVYVLSGQIRRERETACDTAVLNYLPGTHHPEYGRTLLYFINVCPLPRTISLSMDLGGSKSQIKRRLERIADFHREPLSQKVRSLCLFGFTLAIAVVQFPVVAVFAVVPERPYEFRERNVVYEDLSSFFDGLDGSFVLYDRDNKRYTIHDKARSTHRVAPASTYKIYSALMAMDQDIISPEDTQRSWDEKNYPFDAWNRDQDLQSALYNSVTWYFQGLDRQVGKETLETYYSALAYGNGDVSGPIDEYWMESTLRISPVEQVELLTKFYEDKTVFQSEHIAAVKERLRISEHDGAVLSGKTGSGVVNTKGVSGWFIGYVEKDGNTFFFAVYVEGDKDVAGSNAGAVALSILAEKGIY